MESGDHGRVVKGVIESISERAMSTDDFRQHFLVFSVHVSYSFRYMFHECSRPSSNPAVM